MEPRVGQVFFGTAHCKEEPPAPKSPPERKAVELLAPDRGSPISQLQELVQCSKRFPVAQNRSILSWSFDVSATVGGMQRFMATVSCYLHGVPHHLAGGWHSSKKTAQRDAAARALELLSRPRTGAWPHRRLQSSYPPAGANGQDEVLQVESFCSAAAGRGPDGCGSPAPAWSVTGVGDAFVAVLEATIRGIGHSFCGAPQESPEAARRDAARRTLWYLEHPDYLDAFQLPEADDSGGGAPAPSPQQDGQARRAVDSPPVPWQKGAAEEPVAKRPSMADTETRLRKLLGLEPAPVEQVWHWSVQSLEGASLAAPTRYRAAVRVPTLARTFTGPWRHSSLKAQKASCVLLENFLDSWCKEPPPSEAPVPPDPGLQQTGCVVAAAAVSA